MAEPHELTLSEMIGHAAEAAARSLARAERATAANPTPENQQALAIARRNADELSRRAAAIEAGDPAAIAWEQKRLGRPVPAK